MGGVAGTGWSEREGRKDGKGRAQAVDPVEFGGGLGWGERRRLTKGPSLCHIDLSSEPWIKDREKMLAGRSETRGD